MVNEQRTILQEIFLHKHTEVERSREATPQEALELAARAAAPARDFLAALRRGGEGAKPRLPALIAEIKRGSPSRGVLAPDLDPLGLARIYRDNGAAAISILTDERYFGGRLETLRQAAGLERRPPLLRKDFIYDPYQVYEARAAGADAILLIAAGLSARTLGELHELARELGMSALVEVHTRQEIDLALSIQPALIGINNRDLHDFQVRLETTERLRPLIPEGICVVAESGIHNLEEARRMGAAGVEAILVGEALVTAPEVGARVRELAWGEAREAP